MEEVRGCDMDRVAGPCKEVLVVGRYVKDLVGNLPEEGSHLGGRDQRAQAGVWVVVNRGWVVVWHVEALCAGQCLGSLVWHTSSENLNGRGM